MNNKRILAVLCALALMVGMAACNTSGGNSSTSSLPGGTPGTAGAGTELNPETSPDEPADNGDDVSSPDGDGAPVKEQFSDDNVTIDLELDRADYTINDIIGLKVTITNNAETPIVFTQGSGSNRIPDGLKVTLGELTAMYQPVVATMDMRYESIAAGKSVTYELPYAPYVAAGESLLGPGLDQTLEFFLDNEDYTAAEVGDLDGTLTFTYQLMESESIEGPYTELSEGGNPHVITGQFSTGIVDAL